MLCVLNFIHKWRELQFKVASERQIFEKLFIWQFYLPWELTPNNGFFRNFSWAILLTLREEINEKNIYFFIFRLVRKCLYGSKADCIIYIHMLFISILFGRYLQRRSSNHNCFLHTQLHTRLTEFLLLVVALSCRFIIQHK